MAFNINYKFWVVTSQDLKDIILRQHAVRKLKPREKLDAHDVLAEIYARYVLLVNKLGYLFDKTCQVQKRALVRRLLEASSKRLLELRNEMKKLELSEFVYLDKTLVQRKLIPHDIQLMRPFYFPYLRSEEIEQIIYGPRIGEVSEESESSTVEIHVKGSASFDAVLEDLDTPDSPTAEGKRPSQQKIEGTEVIAEAEDKEANVVIKKKRKKKLKQEPDEKLSYEEQQFINAVKLIQAHERARRARVYYTNIRLHPEKYAPRPPDLERPIKYEFMHKPDQPMLINVKRTIYGANYYIEFKPVEDFNYYEKPKPKKKSRNTQEDLSLPTDSQVQVAGSNSLENLSLHRDFLKGGYGSFQLLVDQEPHYAESYFWKGILQETGDLKKIEKVVPPIEAEEEDTPSIRSFKLKAKQDAAARLIQNVWRLYKIRKAAKARHLQKKILYGMVDERKRRKDISKDIKEMQTIRRKKKEWFDQQFIQACEDEKVRILKVRAPWIMEDISDHIRAWFKEFYYGALDFDRYPEEFEGGTILLVKGETMTLDEFKKKQGEKKKTKAEKKKEAEKLKAAKEKEKLKEEKARKAAKRQAELARKRGGFTLDFNTFVENENVVDLEKTMREYEIEWEHINERNNVKEELYMEWITLDKYAEVHKELRIVVDELMRIEFELLRKALAKDKKKKYKPQKKKKQKKKKKGKKKGKKGATDITADRSTQSLFYEMEDRGLIKRYKRRSFDEFIGDYNFCAYEMRNFLTMDPEPSVGEIKDILREWIMGLGPLDQPKAKAICIAGPDESGKNFIMECVATEIDAVMIDLSPEVVVQFQDKMPYLIHLVTKMAKILQPTLIAINEVHRVFWKKVPKDQADLNPRLLGKYLNKKIVKPLKKEDKILVVGMTSAPWQAKPQMKKCFDKFLLMPRTDYATSFLLWRSTALSMLGIPRDFEFSPLALVTKDYKIGDICNTINATLNIKRRIRLNIEPVNHKELLEGFFLSGPEPLFPPKETDYKKYLKWFMRVNKLAKQRAKYVKQMMELKEQQKAKEESKAGKKT